MDISHITARTVIDSRGYPTVEADVVLTSGAFGRAAVPSGASTGSAEAHELRDGDITAYGGKGVTKAVGNINNEIATALIGQSVDNQAAIDEQLIALDGTENKGRLGANAILAVSLACAKATANAKNQPLYRHIQHLAQAKEVSLPMPMMNIINGGKHAAGSTDIQEFMIIPKAGATMQDRVRIGTEIFHTLKAVLQSKGYATTVGDEGGYAPAFKHGNKEALDTIIEAIQRAGFQPGNDVSLALDVAATELLIDETTYFLATEDKKLQANNLIKWYEELIAEFPISSIEDGLAETDWDGWISLTKLLGEKIQLVGDDLLVTNPILLERGISQTAANAILIKPNQIGTLTETIQAVQIAKQANWGTVMSHRSGETEDTTIAHLAVGLATGQIKTGSLSRSERLAKYNELLRIEESL